MQKKIIALAVAAAFAAPVAAQAEITMYGSMDGGLRHQTNDSTNGSAGFKGEGTTDSMQMGQYNTARFGFKGVDDMGDGMKAIVTLETSLAPGGIGSHYAMTAGQASTAMMPGGGADTNPNNPFGLLFDRQATLGLSSAALGNFEMGWNYTTSYNVIKTYDPFDYKFLAVAGAKTSDFADRAGNVMYKNTFGGVGVSLEYDVNNSTRVAQPATGAGRAIGLTYVSGPINVGAAYTVKEADVGASNTDGVKHTTIGAGYNYGDGKVSIGYAKKEGLDANPYNLASVTLTSLPSGSSKDYIETNMWLGATYNVSSKVTASAAYYSNVKNSAINQTTGAVALTPADATKKTVMVGVTYALSKATTAYLEMDKATSNSGSTGAADTTATGTSIGLNTSF